jgi:hypothetical protein
MKTNLIKAFNWFCLIYNDTTVVNQEIEQRGMMETSIIIILVTFQLLDTVFLKYVGEFTN